MHRYHIDHFHSVFTSGGKIIDVPPDQAPGYQAALGLLGFSKELRVLMLQELLKEMTMATGRNASYFAYLIEENKERGAHPGVSESICSRINSCCAQPGPYMFLAYTKERPDEAL